MSKCAGSIVPRLVVEMEAFALSTDLCGCVSQLSTYSTTYVGDRLLQPNNWNSALFRFVDVA